MIEIEKPQIECIETPGDATYGKYVVEPLERGYGTSPKKLSAIWARLNRMCRLLRPPRSEVARDIGKISRSE